MGSRLGIYGRPPKIEGRFEFLPTRPVAKTEGL